MTDATPAHSSAQRRHTLAALLLLLALAAAAPILLAPGGRSAGAAIDRCAVPVELGSLGAPLPHTAERLRQGGPLTIVALGSSSTEGIGASRPQFSYPSRLAALLQSQFPAMRVRVINRGVSGEIAPQMLARLDRDVLAEKPDLVIWQLGTNSVLHDLDPARESAFAREGIERIRAAGADVMLMDLQYAPGVLLHAEYREMLHTLAAVARSEGVPLVRRFAMMRHWAEDGRMSLGTMLAPDRLHMSDSGYDCLARQVAHSILGNTREETATLSGER
jgi:acyl-CoA thioesterase-1